MGPYARRQGFWQRDHVIQISLWRIVAITNKKSNHIIINRKVLAMNTKYYQKESTKMEDKTPRYQGRRYSHQARGVSQRYSPWAEWGRHQYERGRGPLGEEGLASAPDAGAIEVIINARHVGAAINMAVALVGRTVSQRKGMVENMG